MTPAEIISEVSIELARPDLETRLDAKLRQCIWEAHSLGKFRRDLVVVYVKNPVVEDSKVRVSISSLGRKFRGLYAMEAYANFEEDVEGNVTSVSNKLSSDDLKRANAGSVHKDYYGLAHRNTFLQLGDELVFNYVDSQARILRIVLLSYPRFEQDLLDLEWTVDSWIMEEYPDVIKAGLFHKAYVMTQQQDMIKVSYSEVASAQLHFLSQVTQENLPEPL